MPQFRASRSHSYRRTAAAGALAVALVLTTLTSAVAAGPGGWERVGNGGSSTTLNGAVYTVFPDGPDLYVGGAFTNAGGHANADYFARWDGVSWHAVGPALNGSVDAIAHDGTDWIVGGQFTNAGGDGDADFAARIASTGWEPVCNGPGAAFSGSVAALQIVGSTIYVGGAFSQGGGLQTANYLVACDLATGNPMTTVPNQLGAFNGVVYALTADSNGNLFAGGGFSNLSELPAADKVAYLDTTATGTPGAWHGMGTGAGPGGGAIDDFVRSLTAQGSNVWVGTDALNVGGIPQADHVARWNGTSWSALGANTAGTDGWLPTTAFIYSMVATSNFLVATGSFQNADGRTRADGVAYFDGSQWRPLGSDGNGNGPWIGNGLALGMYRGSVVAGGNFTSAGGDTKAKYVAGFSVRRPDASIALDTSGAYAGGNIYNHNAEGQTKTVSVHRGHSATAYINIQNDGILDANFTVDGSGTQNGYSVHYYLGGNDVTASVRNGTFMTSIVSPDFSKRLRLVVSLGQHAGDVGKFYTIARSSAPNDGDLVLLKVKAL
jgi:hypothetical protein